MLARLASELRLLLEDMVNCPVRGGIADSALCDGGAIMPRAEAREYMEVLDSRRVTVSDQDDRIAAEASGCAVVLFNSTGCVCECGKLGKASLDLEEDETSFCNALLSTASEAVDFRRDWLQSARVLFIEIGKRWLVGELDLSECTSDAQGSSALRLLA